MFLPLLLLIALGTTTLLNPKVRAVVVGLAVVAGLVSSAQNVTTQRTQAGPVAAAINARPRPATSSPSARPARALGVPAGPGHLPVRHDHVPASDRARHRRLGRLCQDGGGASPAVFADDLVQKAHGGHTIWLVWQPDYQTYGIKCEQIAADLSALWPPRVGAAPNIVVNHPALYYEPMNLTEFVVASPASR